jgi:hypothetical protein
MYDIITHHPKSGLSLTTRYSQDWGCWIAFDSETPENSITIGEGATVENARADFWAGFHGYDKTCRLFCPEGLEDRWCLFDGRRAQYFDTRDDAVAYADECEYVLTV